MGMMKEGERSVETIVVTTVGMIAVTTGAMTTGGVEITGEVVAITTTELSGSENACHTRGKIIYTGLFMCLCVELLRKVKEKF